MRRLPGWNEDFSDATSFDELPAAAQKYVAHRTDHRQAASTMIGVGPKRNQTIVKED